MSDEEAIEAVVEGAVAAVNAGDVDGWASSLSDEVIFMPPNQPIVVGRDAVRAWAEPFFIDFDFNESVSIEEVVVSDGWAHVRARYTTTLNPKAEGDATTLMGKILSIFQRQPDGSWQGHIRYRFVTRKSPVSRTSWQSVRCPAPPSAAYRPSIASGRPPALIDAAAASRIATTLIESGSGAANGSPQSRWSARLA